MALRIDAYVRHGEIDGTVCGRLTGTVWLEGVAEPLRLDLEGVGRSDVAGCRVAFRNPRPRPFDAPVPPHPKQRGTLGAFTASRKVRVPEVPAEEFLRAAKEGRAVPWHWANGFYLEWHSERSGRVVIESADFTVEVSAPAWRLDAEERRQQAERSAPGARHDLPGDEAARAAHDEEEDGQDEEEAFEGPMDEFQWERFMKESDRRTDKYMALFEKYANDPDRDSKVAREMGWDWLVEALEQQAGEGPEPGPDGDDLDEEAIGDAELPEPDPLREGIDWVRDEDGDICHPLYVRARRVTHAFWEACRDRDLVHVRDGGEGDATVNELVFSAHMLTAKLAGALNGLSRHDLYESGFVVASVKRAMKYLNEALGLAGQVRARGVMEAPVIEGFERELFEVRAAMYEIMEEHRRRLG